MKLVLDLSLTTVHGQEPSSVGFVEHFLKVELWSLIVFLRSDWMFDNDSDQLIVVVWYPSVELAPLLYQMLAQNIFCHQMHYADIDVSWSLASFQNTKIKHFTIKSSSWFSFANATLESSMSACHVISGLMITLILLNISK